MANPNRQYERTLEVVKLYLQNELTMEEIAKKTGYSSRTSVYNAIRSKQGQEIMEKLANESVNEALSILRSGSKDAAKKLIEIAKSGEGNSKQVYAQIQAITNILEKSGLNTKNIVLENKKDKQEKVSVEELEEMFNEDVDDE